MAKKGEQNKGREFWRKLKFKYKVSIINENTLEEMWRMRASAFWGIVMLVAFAFVLILMTSIIIITTPIRNYLPGYLSSEVRETALRSAVEIEALDRKVATQEVYIENLKKVIDGKGSVDSVKIEPLVDTVKVSIDDPRLKKSERERQFVENYASEDMFNLSVLVSTADLPMNSIVFYKPVKGLPISSFNMAESHYGVKISINEKETVLAALEGTVIYAGYTMDEGYMLQIQHANGFISVYKHNTLLLAKVGDAVRTGSAIAVVGESNPSKKKKDSEKEKTTYLEFELWFNGKPVDPQNYIYFN